MTTVLVTRPARVDLGDSTGDGDPLVLATPPQQSDQQGGSTNVAAVVMPLVSGSGSLLITLTNQNRPLFAAAGLLFMVVSVGLGVVLFVGTRSSARRRQRTNRERYLDYLERMRRDLRETSARQRDSAAQRHPAPDELLDIARLPARRWERRPGDPDFLDVRLGTGTAPLATGLSVQVDRTDPLITYDPVCLMAVEALVVRYAVLGDQPITMSLAGLGWVSVVGERRRTRNLARSIIGQLVTLHAPDDVRIAVVRATSLAAHWDWVKWLPHNQIDASASDSAANGTAAGILVTSSFPELLSRVAEDVDARRTDAERRRGRRGGDGPRRLVVIVDGEFQHSAPQLDARPSGALTDLGIHIVTLVAHRREEPEQVDLRITLESNVSQLNATNVDNEARVSAALAGGAHAVAPTALRAIDEVGTSSATALARSLSALRLAEDDTSHVLTSTVGLRDILGVPDVAELDPHSCWRARSARDFLRVPVGIGVTGQPVCLDLKESARAGMGPHGLVVGATGSGKSELLRTMVTSLVIGHPPERLALLLVDFKGGATFAGFAPLPHLAGLVTNLADDATLVQRFRDALYGELTRRQRVLADAGNLPNLQAYTDLREQRGGLDGLEPLPHLLVIIDEFTELLTARPDFAELFLAVGRIGRSIGVHLLLATQRLDAGKIRGLDSHLSYRIGLRTFSESESRAVLGVADAYQLPPEPGAGYLKVDTTVFEQFKAALVSTPYHPPISDSRAVAPVVVFSTETDVDQRRNLDPPPESAISEFVELIAPQTILDVAVQRLSGGGIPRVRQVWIAPLPPALSLDSLPGGIGSTAEGGDSDVTALLGLKDLPEEQRQIPLTWNFAGPQGNLLVLGAALSGKSLLLRTMICSLALRYAPGEVGVYGIDYGGGALAALQALPHVAGISTRSDPDRVRRTVADVVGMLDTRERLISQHDWDGPDGLRRARRGGSTPADVLGDVLLVIDGWASLREAEPELEDQIMTIANRGPSLGVHTVVSAATAAQVRMRLAATLPGRIELRLTDAFDSAIDRRLAESVPVGVPGRALVAGGRFVQIALPRIDGQASVNGLPVAVDDLVGQVRDRWPDAEVPAVRVLPSLVLLADLHPGSEPRPGPNGPVPVGVSERNLAQAAIDLFGSDAHLQVYGESQSGKSAFLRTLLRQLVGIHPANDIGIVLVDYRRAHLDLVPADHLLAYCTGAVATRDAIAEICLGLAQRLPGGDVTSQQLRARDWWTGRQVVVLVDDYDLVVGSAGNPLTGLIEYLPHGADLGLHVVTARRTGGASRAMFEPMTQTLTDLAGPGLLFSGDRTEGRLVAGIASMQLPAGRAILARRGQQAEQVQIAWSDPA